MFHEFSSGSCFFLPQGKKVLRKLEDYFRFQYRQRGYDEVDTPNIASSDLLKISGEHQCGAVQFDFQLPERFDLKY